MGNYTDFYPTENVIEWLKGDTEATVTFCQGNRFTTMVRKLAEKYPDRIRITHDDNKTFMAKIPVSTIRISVIEQNLTEEERKAVGERLRNSRINAATMSESGKS